MRYSITKRTREKDICFLPISQASLIPNFITEFLGKTYTSYVLYRPVTVNGELPLGYYIFISTEEALLSPIKTVLNIQKLESSLQSPDLHKTSF